jgi:hypothetical protein
MRSQFAARARRAFVAYGPLMSVVVGVFMMGKRW